MSAAISFFFLLLLAAPLVMSAASETDEDGDDEEISVLLNLRTHLQKKSGPKVFLSWRPTTPKCNFTGITCNSLLSVTEIDLSHRSLAGTLPLDQICTLTSLHKLSLGFNSLHGSISPHLDNCTQLQYLDLGNNLFSGSFPPFSSLARLAHLYLNLTGISGPFPWHSLPNMTDLHTLSLGDNPLDSSPFPSQLLTLTSLTWLYLSNCSLTGDLPSSLGNLTSLIDLELADNTLSGHIPPSITRLTNLWQLELYDNGFAGRLPVGFGNLTSLQFFDASNNNLEGDLSELRTLTSLVSLQLFQNRFTGTVPPEFGKFTRIVNLSLYMNNLTGPLPQDLGSWAEFNFIDVSENGFTGEIPPDMCKKKTMQKLLMIQNRLTGVIPSTYSNCTSLYRFRVKDNLLTGVLPSAILALPNLSLFDVRMNRLHGGITPEISKASSLAQLLASDNLLSGELPPEISKASSLVTIDLDNNRISGGIPESLGELKSLSRLHLQGNRLSGVIPESLASCTSLEDLNLAGNSISGGIPPSLASLPSLKSLNISGNALSGGIPPGLASLGLSLLDLSRNKLSGPIPKGLYIEAYNGSFDGNSGLCSPAVSSFMSCPSDGSSPVSSRVYHAIIGTLVMALVALLLVLACFVKSKGMTKRRRRLGLEEGERSLREEKWDLKSYQVLSFTEEVILDGINQENLIGKGGSGKVYRVGVGEGKELAVKHIWQGDGGRSKEFEAEVEALSSIRHVNVVKLYCSICSRESSLLVYEFMPNGSLWDRLHVSCEKMALDWESRYEIAVGAAKGLEYLHHGCERTVIHRDVKSSNILLDQFLKPRIADFGLAKMSAPHSCREFTTRVIAGTPGYFAPEYGYTWKVSEKCDVYSFGVVLMELVTGKKPIGEKEYGENEDIVKWVCNRFGKKETALGAVDSRIVEECYREDGVKMMRIAILCTARLPEHRPTMRAVVKMLEEADPSRLFASTFPKPRPPPPPPPLASGCDDVNSVHSNS